MQRLPGVASLVAGLLVSGCAATPSARDLAEARQLAHDRELAGPLRRTFSGESSKETLVPWNHPLTAPISFSLLTLTDGRVIEEMIVEQGWIVALDRSGLAGTFECRIDFDPRTITAIDVIQVA